MFQSCLFSNIAMSIANVTNLCRLCGQATTPDHRRNIFSLHGKTLGLQRIIYRVAAINVADEDALPKHIFRKCYRNLTSLKNKLASYQSACAVTQTYFTLVSEKSPDQSPQFSESETSVPASPCLFFVLCSFLYNI